MQERFSYTLWREKARALLIKGVSPEDADWGEHLLSDLFARPLRPVMAPKVTREFLDLAEAVACARDDDRWSLLYRLLFRLHHENPNLLNISVDKDVNKAQLLAKSVHRDIHKMHAFVRFKRVLIEEQETFVAWHKPEHLVLSLAAPFFVRRFGDRPWSIFTPDQSAHWNLQELSFSEGMPQHEFVHEDPFDDIWKSYYKSIFNPARLKIKMMKAEMPTKYWGSLPEADIIQDLIREAPQRLQNLANTPRYLAEPPLTSSWEELSQAAKNCSACPLAEKATQTVFGEGAKAADLMIVGEQPGHEEDLNGQVFIGPAGEVLAQAFAAAGILKEKVYVTNAVKHFKWTPSENGKARIHKKASGPEMHACKPWLEAEIKIVRPKVILALGVTAGTSLYGRLVQIKNERGEWNKSSVFAPHLTLSWHPSAILRAGSESDQQRLFQELVADLKKVAEQAGLIS